MWYAYERSKLGKSMSAVVKPRRNNPRGVKQSLLDSAEELFSQHGFDGVSVRDIVSHAGLRISSLTYYFESKADLFDQVLARRSKEYVGLLEQSIAEMMVQTRGKPTAEDAVRAYLTPYFRIMEGTDQGWINYAELVQRSMSVRQSTDALTPLLREMYPAHVKLIEAFGAVQPDADLEDLNWSIHFIVSATIQLLNRTGWVDRQSDGLCRSSDLSRILEKVIPFLAAGFERLTLQGATSQSEALREVPGDLRKAGRTKAASEG